jgi:hypothetical protein
MSLQEVLNLRRIIFVGSNVNPNDLGELKKEKGLDRSRNLSTGIQLRWKKLEVSIKHYTYRKQ